MTNAVELTEEMEIPQAVKAAAPIGARAITTLLAVAVIGYGAITGRDYAVERYEEFLEGEIAARLHRLQVEEFTLQGKGGLRLSTATQAQVAELLLQVRTDQAQCEGKLENIKGILQYGY